MHQGAAEVFTGAFLHLKTDSSLVFFFWILAGPDPDPDPGLAP